MFSPGDAEQLLADAVGHFQIVGQLGTGQLALVESVDSLRILGVTGEDKPYSLSSINPDLVNQKLTAHSLYDDSFFENFLVPPKQYNK